MNFYLATWLLNIGLLFSCVFTQNTVYTSNEFKQHHYGHSQGLYQSVSKAKMQFDCVNSEAIDTRNGIGISFASHPNIAVKQLNVHSASPKVQEYIHNCLLQLQQGIWYVVTGHHYAVLKGYYGDSGLRSLLPDFVATNKTDDVCVSDYNNRFQSYISCVENIVFDGSRCFKEVISKKSRERLAWAYALFLEEFSLGDARAEIRNLAKSDPVFASVYKQMVNPGWLNKAKNIVWSFLGGNDYYCRQSVFAARDAATGHGALGQLYRLIEEKKFDEARDLLDKQITYKKWFWGRTISQSVREKYTIVRQIVLSASEQQTLREQTAAFAQDCQEHVQQLNSPWYDDIARLRAQECAETADKAEWLECSHFVSPATRELVGMQRLADDQCSIVLKGSVFQQGLLVESLTVLDDLSDLKLDSSYDKRLDLLSSTIVDCANVSIDFNQQGEVVKAYRAVDASYALLECLTTGMNYLANSAKTVGVRVAIPALRGVDKGIRSCTKMACHPIKTVGDFVDSVAVCTKYVGLAALEIGCLDAKIDMGVCSDAELLADITELVGKYVFTAEAVGDAAQAITLECGVEEAVAFGVEALFLHGVGKFCSFVNKKVPTIIKDVAEGVKASEVAITAEGVPVRVAADSLTECMSAAKKSAGKIIGTAETRTLAEVQAARSVGNMHEFFKNWEFGKKLKQYCRRTNYLYQNETVYEITKNVPGTQLEKGFRFYLDKFHKDHIEVFTANGNVETVLNLDGSFNLKKFEKALADNRTIKT